VLKLAPGHPAWWREGQHAAAAPTPLVVALPSTKHAASVEVLPAVLPSPRAAETAAAAAPARREKEPVASHAPTTKAAEAAGSASPTGMFPGPWYYPARYLHRRPSPLKPIWPDYPAEHEKIRGRVVILLLINEEGTVDQHKIESAEPPGVFEESVRKAFTGAVYAPALITGYKVKSQLLAEVFFEPGAPPKTSFSIMDQAQPIQGPASSLGKGN
jgi:protein TonB